MPLTLRDDGNIVTWLSPRATSVASSSQAMAVRPLVSRFSSSDSNSSSSSWASISPVVAITGLRSPSWVWRLFWPSRRFSALSMASMSRLLRRFDACSPCCHSVSSES